MVKEIDITGKKFNKLTAIKKILNKRWLFKCDCGNEKIILKESVISGKTTSCGCYSKEIKLKRAFRGSGCCKVKHNNSDSRLCKIYYGMRKRCLNQKSIVYKYYGGKGIKICDEWLDKENGSSKFMEWAIKNGYNDGLTIDRINPNGNYCPENCRWITSKAQNNNRTNNILYSYNGETHNINEWCEILGLKYSTVYTRLFREKIPFEEAIKRENHDNKNRKKVYCVESGSVFESIKNAAKSINGSSSNLILHIKNGKEYKGFHWRYL